MSGPCCLFLDIDGVLNDHRINPEAECSTLKPECVAPFNRILQECRPQVVLSSAWRYMLIQGAITLAGFGYLLRTHGVAREISDLLIGWTLADEQIATRGLQIANWLPRTQGPVVILDDAPSGMCFAPVEDRLVRTDATRGLTAEVADRVIARLQGKE